MNHYSPQEASEWENVAPLPAIEPLEIYHARLRRSMMWDLAGPLIPSEPERFGQVPASPDVLEVEFNEMALRKQSLLPLGLSLDIACRTAAEAATMVSLATDKSAGELSEEDKMKYLANNVRISEAVTRSVISHFISTGILQYGARV
jgi:hypothetical protein